MRARSDERAFLWLGDVTVVGGVEHGRGNKAVDEQCVTVFLNFVFDRRVVGGDFNDDVDIVG